MVTGIVYKMWSSNQFNTIDQMIDSTKVSIKIEMMEKTSKILQTSIENVKSKKHRLKLLGDTEIYSYICYSVIKTMSDNTFYQTGDQSTTEKRYCNLIDKLLKNLYNSARTPESQKEIIRKDKKLKYLILEVIRSYEIFRTEDNTIEFNQSNIESFQKDINGMGPRICSYFIVAINIIIQS